VVTPNAGVGKAPRRQQQAEPRATRELVDVRYLRQNGERGRPEGTLVAGERRGDVEATFAEATHAVRVVLQIARALGAEIECGVIVGVRRHLRREIRMQQLPAGESRRLERLGGE